MAERLVNEFTVNRPIDEAWAVITDVERIAPCMPGAQLQEIEGDIYRGVVKIKLGSIAPQFKGQATFVERDDDDHRAVLKAEGRDTGGRGNAAAEITAQAESLSPTSTRCIVSTDLHITGKVAQFGRGIIGDVSKKLMAQFASNLNTMLDERDTDVMASADEPSESDGEQDPPGDDGDTPPSPTDAPDGAGETGGGDAVASASGNGGAAAADAGGPAGTTAPATPSDAAAAGNTAGSPAARLRKIDGPANEPVDLAGVAGPALLKRVLPVLGGVLLLLLVLRRRRRA